MRSPLRLLVPLLALSCSRAKPPSDGPAAAPIVASFVDLTATPFPIRASVCDSVYVVVARGTATALGETLAAGDVLMVQGPDPFDVTGDGLALVADDVVSPCTPKARPAGPFKHVVRASAAPEVTWANGTMHAHLDLEKSVSPEVYVGRLEGTATVAEHVHESSTEIACTIEGAGTFTIDGKASRVGPRSIVTIPPTTKHSWNPDAGVKLVAIQIYSPPGPEQRFKSL